MPLRDHQSTVIDQFNGLWDRNNPDEVPSDHFQDCKNIKYKGTNSFGTRDGVGIHQSVAVPLASVVRLYNYPTQTANTLLALTWDGTTGKIYHVVNSATVHGPILTKTGMSDFAFIPYAGRAYITPFNSFTTGDLNIQKGLQSEFLYVYLGAGVAARKAGGTGSGTGTLTVANGAAGLTDAGLHLFGVVGETDTGFLSAPFAFASFTTSANLSVSFSTVPVLTGAWWTKRHIVATKIIVDYNGNTTGYQYFFIPNATINNNTATTLSNISFFDIDLLDDASHLLDNFQEIPAGATLSLYHDRLCLSTTFSDISIALISAQGEPEAISQVDGLIIAPLDGNPITNTQELRDVFYVFKRSRTLAYVDNDDVPSSWPLTTVDNSYGTSVHGISTVLDSGASSTDYLLVSTYQGIILFNGKYALPELTWKISNTWAEQNRNEYKKIQMVINSSIQELYCVLPDGRLLVGNYANGLNPKNIRWAPWSFGFTVSSIALVNIDELIIGAS